MRKCHNMSYTQVKFLNAKANCPRSLVVRSLYARKLLEYLKQDFRVLNIDESFLDVCDFRRRRWARKDESNSQPKHNISPRLSVISAIDTDGEVYLSLSTAKTRSEEFCLFMKRLMLRLQAQDENWKARTLFLLDAAMYHRSADTRNYLCNAGAKVVVGGPYAFAAAPIEHFFSALKAVDLNPNKIKTGKR